ncbi:hypothetical protein [Devosia sp.]|uniref:hypothetical protein n=1 Tax=Devosia sp. TaxID=1871048 RepID=UPI003A91F9BF
MARRAARLVVAALLFAMPVTAHAEAVMVEPRVTAPDDAVLSQDAAELFWCASTLYWLMTDAYDSGDLAQAQDFEAMAGRFATAATDAATGQGYDLEAIGAIGAGYDQQALDDLADPASFNRIALCISRDAAREALPAEPAVIP